MNISSIASIRAIGYPCISCADSKGAVNQLTQQIAIQYSEQGIRANSILPGLMHTSQIEHYVRSGYGDNVDQMIQQRREMADRINNAAECWVKAHAGASKEAASRRAASWMWSMIGSRVRQQISQISQRCEPSVPEASNQLMSPWLGVLDAIGESERLLEANVNLSIVCDHLAMAMNRSLAPVAT